MADFMIVVVVLCIVSVAVAYIVKEKKRGAKCIGCPAGGQCGSCHTAGSADAGCSCGCHADTNGEG